MKRVYILLAVIAFLIFAQGCGLQNAKNATAVAVKTAVVLKKDMPLEVKSVGHVEAYNSVNIVPRVTGKIISLNFTPGAIVHAGDLLAVIEPQSYEAALQQAAANVEKIRAQKEYAELEYNRKKPLLASGAITSEELSQLKSQADYSVAGLAEAVAQRDQAQVDLNHCYIRSPLTGKAGDWQMDAGNIAIANSTVITSVNQFQPVYVLFNVPESYANAVLAANKTGPVEVKACDDKGAVLAVGKLVFSDNSINKSVGTFTLKAQYSNDPVKLYPGQYVQAAARIGTLKGAIIVPAAAVQPYNDGGVVFTIDSSGKAKLHNVKIEQYFGSETAISGDILPGEEVVIDGQLNLTDGAMTKKN